MDLKKICKFIKDNSTTISCSTLTFFVTLMLSVVIFTGRKDTQNNEKRYGVKNTKENVEVKESDIITEIDIEEINPKHYDFYIYHHIRIKSYIENKYTLYSGITFGEDKDDFNIEFQIDFDGTKSECKNKIKEYDKICREKVIEFKKNIKEGS